MLGLLERTASQIVPVSYETKKSSSKDYHFPSLGDFIHHVVSISNSLPATVLGSVVYIQRLARKLSTRAQGYKDTPYRLFTTALLLSTKFHVDTPIRNDEWIASVSPWFSLSEINAMERQFLRCIDYNMAIRPSNYQEVIASDPNLLGILHSSLWPLYAPKLSSPPHSWELEEELLYDEDPSSAYNIQQSPIDLMSPMPLLPVVNPLLTHPQHLSWSSQHIGCF